ncbi:hypothetical protein Q5E84_18750, partial [Providencia sp. CRE-138-0026]
WMHCDMDVLNGHVGFKVVSNNSLIGVSLICWKIKLNQLTTGGAKLGVEMFGTSSCGKCNDIGVVNRCVVFKVVSNNSFVGVSLICWKTKLNQLVSVGLRWGREVWY